MKAAKTARGLASYSEIQMIMKTLKVALMTGCSVLASLGGASGALTIGTLNTAVTENFDSLASSGTSSTTPNGWLFSETGANADTTYTAGNGSGNTGDTYSFGATGSTERAFGGLLSGSLTPILGAQIQNASGSTISSLIISYYGEQWRLGASGRADKLDFQYSFNATSLTTGSWTDVDALDFTAPKATGTAGALDGNLTANRTLVSTTVSALSIADGATIWIRWNDFNAAGADDGLAIDDFSITANGAEAVVPEPSTYIAGLLLALPFGVHGIRYLRNRKRA